MWSALLRAWGFPFERVEPNANDSPEVTTLIVPAPLAGSVTTEATVLAVGSGKPAGNALRFEPSADALTASTLEEVVDSAAHALEAAAPAGLVAIAKWPFGRRAALVVDGDVDHPSGVDPECSRYVAPAIETAKRAGFPAYGIFVAGANVEAEPSSFPSGAEYYNHSFSHPYSHWNDRPWESLGDAEMETEITRCRSAFERELGVEDHAMFRSPHFQLEASDRTYAILDRLGYLADSSIGGNVSITGGLPFHPAIEPWSDRPDDAAFARTDPEPARTRALLQVPISTDPTDPAFPHGCCSYNTLGEGVRTRTADPAAYEGVLQEVLDRAVARGSLAHLFIDPPDAGYGRLAGDLADYASAVERWMRRAIGRSDLSILSLAGLVSWWLEREAALQRLRWRVENGRLRISLPDAPAGAALSVLAPVEVGGGWSTVALESEAA
jgi:peptidoglycan/xylan/chitin deacetylase (PgdA/CDA1 family)